MHISFINILTRALFVLFLTIITINSNCWAINPTAESLLRNASNKTITANSSIIKFCINEELNLNADEKASKIFVELTFYMDKTQGNLTILQKIFNDEKMNKNSLLDVFYIDNSEGLLKEFTSDKIGTSRNIFYSLFYYLFSNHRGLVTRFLKENNDDFQFNKEIINKEKFELLDKYKVYLQQITQNPALKKTETSPLLPTNPSEKAKIMGLLAENSFYVNKNIFLTNESGEFTWKVLLKNSEMLFNNNQHLLKYFYHHNQDFEFELSIDEYSSFLSLFNAPRYITLKTFEQKNYVIKTLSLEHKDISHEIFVKKATELRPNKNLFEVQYLKQKFPFLF
ncbi:MAG: hypothetical protein HQK51_01095 [Oligoflexia bacterium]|nr:hypothetical protein [Oligoflexia bacterium]